MIFRNYLESLIGSKVKIKLLRSLLKFPEKKFTSRELAKFIGCSHTAVLKSLDDLKDMNILELSRHGTANVLSINRKSCLYNKLKKVFLAEEETFLEFKDHIKSVLPLDNVKICAIFGSIAEGKEKSNSDIDLFIVTEKKDEIEALIAAKQNIISQTYGNVISLYVLTPKEYLKKRNTKLLKEIKKNAVLLRGVW